ncbi:hypothetical protein AQ505_12145 [Pedobacter sp. PACM 27299]|uniref:helix-turn-helix transcriptional regulator n=1 Tax=Pedobacter sp. PACM 27299 TaxID=1727164 RepID=UPI0007063CF0|nr:hypothetical protein [Pedobacter sp. PACM 27299]ALL06175.1 hypothetical protein AQ505_12145 [Pedobacter sp. PACM 27299]
MLIQKLVVVGYDDALNLLALMDQLKETTVFAYQIISATMASGLTDLLHTLKPDLIILCFRNNQQVLNEIRPLTAAPLIPILCLSNRFENENLGWDQNNSVFTCQLEYIHQSFYLSSRINSILLMTKAQKATEPPMSFAAAAIIATGPDHTRNLSRYVMELDQKVEVLLKVKERIGELYPNVDDQTRGELISIVNSIKISANDHKLWDDFKLYFEEMNPGFLLELTSNYPSLTSIDLKYCCYLKMNMSNDDIKNLLGINQESVRTHKYRLKKKMSLTREQDLRSYLRNLDQQKLTVV